MIEYPISDEQVRFYEENGYVQLDNVLDPAGVDTLRDALAQAVEDKKKYNLNLGPRTDEGYTKVFLQMVNLWVRRSPAG
jgi:phytanoyl-CoA hydroxylase